jgi:hypothetical protein
MTREIAKSSDQLPEEGPAEIVPDDVPGAPEGAARTAARRQARQANKRRHGPGDAREEPEVGLSALPASHSPATPSDDRAHQV